MGHLLPHLIKTQSFTGLTEEITQRVIDALNAPSLVTEKVAEGGSSPAAGYAIFHGLGGYECERKQAKATLEVGKAYKVIGGTEHSCVTYIELEGIEGDWNTALFDCDRKTLPFTRMADRYILPPGTQDNE
jgi:hypothetical protein